ncbi:hypothetical protein CEXT_105761 [Caerostris extrusa]|uniref:Uncharacterized protein n=1 Tax=Caerostris extrusa TaxID=172846 RepID=A0AAV4P6N4_CAEEX|nr:hypothetical protein CEXT_105761 [Caerostris extrusa]
MVVRRNPLPIVWLSDFATQLQINSEVGHLRLCMSSDVCKCPVHSFSTPPPDKNGLHQGTIGSDRYRAQIFLKRVLSIKAPIQFNPAAHFSIPERKD